MGRGEEEKEWMEPYHFSVLWPWLALVSAHPGEVPTNKAVTGVSTSRHFLAQQIFAQQILGGPPGRKLNWPGIHPQERKEKGRGHRKAKEKGKARGLEQDKARGESQRWQGGKP
jgi:hypothetical protein